MNPLAVKLLDNRLYIKDFGREVLLRQSLLTKQDVSTFWAKLEARSFALNFFFVYSLHQSTFKPVFEKDYESCVRFFS